MDFDLLPDILKDGGLSSSPQLLNDLPSSQLINHGDQQESTSSRRSARFQDTSLPTPSTLTHVKSEEYDPKNTSSLSYQTGSAISKIEEICEAMTDCIIGRRKQFSIHLRSRNLNTEVASEDSKQPPISKGRVVQFPNSSSREAWKFSALLRILELSHEALVTGNIITKRDLYYRDPELFTKQTVVDRLVDDVAYTLGLKRDALNVMAAAKGLVAGSFVIKRRNKSVVDYSSASQLVPWVKEIEEVDVSQVKWILVIEKEATFRTLAEIRYWEASIAGKGILLTAKGYPDIQSRQFLHYLCKNHPLIPIYALVDFDPDGIGIMSTYKYGSIALAYENEDLSVPSIRWLGLRSTDMMQGGEENEGLLKLTKRDRRLAVKMLQRDVCQEKGSEEEWRRELQTMLMLNKKAEIQIIGNGDALEYWLNRRLRDQGVEAGVS